MGYAKVFILALCFFLAGCSAMKIESPAFEEGGSIPVRYTCDGENISPELRFSGVPESAVSLVLLMEDPDVPRYVREDGMWDHWVVFNIPADTVLIREGESPEGVMGSTTRGTLSYGGPCPPDKEHRYYFRLYALDVELSLDEGATKQEVLDAMEGHVLVEAVLMGRYARVEMAL